MSASSFNSFFVSLSAPLAPAAPLLSAVAFLLSLVAVTLLIWQHRRLSRLMHGRSNNWEEAMGVFSRDIKELRAFRSELEKYLKTAEVRLRSAVRGVGVVRFNPFATGQGGNQSFAAAFLDEEGNGVVFSTLYARDRVGVYAKPLEHGASSFELTQEEKDAVARATAETKFKKS